MKHPKRSQYNRLTAQNLALLTRVEEIDGQQRKLYPLILNESFDCVAVLLDSCLKKLTPQRLSDLKLEAQILAEFVISADFFPREFVAKMGKLCRKFTQEYQGLLNSAGAILIDRW